jgi:hypothetical protein
MITFYTQWDVGDTVLLRCGSGILPGNRRAHGRHLPSYYNVAISGRGRIDLRTGRLNGRRRD